MNLLADDELERSAVVANCRMNRERELVGSNGYEKEVGFNPLEFLRERTASGRGTAWLDLCCSSGKALIQAAEVILAEGLQVAIVGVDLLGMFHRHDHDPMNLRLIEASLRTWRPDRSFDLIACVHGLHYVGDKLGLIARAASWLADDGLFVASLDLENIKLADEGAGSASSRPSYGEPAWSTTGGNGWWSAVVVRWWTCRTASSEPTTGPGRTTRASLP